MCTIDWGRFFFLELQAHLVDHVVVAGYVFMVSKKEKNCCCEIDDFVGTHLCKVYLLLYEQTNYVLLYRTTAVHVYFSCASSVFFLVTQSCFP